MKTNINFKRILDNILDFSRKIGRRNLIIIGAVLLIGCAIYLNFIFFSDPFGAIGYGNNNMEDDYINAEAGNDETNAAAEENDTNAYFTSTQVNRQRARDEALEVLQTVIDSDDALKTTKDQAMSDVSRIALDIEKESNIESMVISKGFEQCVAVINGSSISVIVKSDGLLPNEVAQINEIVYEQTGIPPVNVKIIQKTA